MHPVLRSAIGAAKAVRVRLFRPAAGAATLALLRRFAFEVHATLLRVFAYGAALGVLGLGAAEFVTASRITAVAQPMAPRDWIEVVRPLPAFAVSIAEFEQAPRYAIWRHASGGGRKDIMTFGDPDAATAAVEIYRPGSEADQHPDGDDVTTSIPGLRLSGRVAAPESIDTKFGPVTLVEFTDRAEAGARRCLRFTHGFDEPPLAISGRFCNAGVELVDRAMVACALDRLTLLAAGSEPKLATLFARAELKRSFCGQKSVFLAATPKRIDWIEAARDPKLRGRSAEF